MNMPYVSSRPTMKNLYFESISNSIDRLVFNKYIILLSNVNKYTNTNEIKELLELHYDADAKEILDILVNKYYNVCYKKDCNIFIMVFDIDKLVYIWYIIYSFILDNEDI